jgi:predicted nicotinamide N-methyase
VRNWARRLPPGAAVLDLGCGSGFPNTEMLLAEGLNVYAVDASPSLVQAFQRNLANTPVACEAVEDSTFLPSEIQWSPRMGLNSSARYKESRTHCRLVAACCLRRVLSHSCEKDAMMGLEPRSLGATEYRR